MDSNQRKEKIVNQDITMYELEELFLELKYEKISLNSYGTYKQRIGIINEFFRNKMISDITKVDLINFERYLRKIRKWNNVDSPAEYSIRAVIYVLNELLNKAIFWNFIKEIPQERIDKNSESKNIRIPQIKNINDKIIENEKMKIARNMDSILRR